MPLSEEQIIPELLKECPELQPAWDKYAADWAEFRGGEPPGVYNNASAMIHPLIDFFERGETEIFPRFFAVVERLITDGDEEARNIAVVGYLETLQTAALHKKLDLEVFAKYLLPASRKWWDETNAFWRGERHFIGEGLQREMTADDIRQVREDIRAFNENLKREREG
jgi:hypothetical protein